MIASHPLIKLSLAILAILLVGCQAPTLPAPEQTMPVLSPSPVSTFAAPTSTHTPNPVPTQTPSPSTTPTITQPPPTDTLIPPTPTLGIGSAVIETGWLEWLASGIISLDQPTSQPQDLTTSYLLHGSTTYVLDIPDEAEMNLPPEDRQGGQYILHSGAEYVYRVEGTLAEPIGISMFTSEYPAIRVNSIERILIGTVPGSIAYVSNSDGYIHFISSNPAEESRILSGAEFYLYLSWSPDGARLVYTSGENFDLYVMNADGSDVQRLTDSYDAAEWNATWSPDGNQLAFSYSLNPENPEIYVMNADGSEQRPLISGTSIDLHPAWSPDGSRLPSLQTEMVMLRYISIHFWTRA
jgi:hypothetical protein